MPKGDMEAESTERDSAGEANAGSEVDHEQQRECVRVTSPRPPEAASGRPRFRTKSTIGSAARGYLETLCHVGSGKKFKVQRVLFNECPCHPEKT